MKRLALLFVAILFPISVFAGEVNYDCLTKLVLDPKRISKDIPLDHNIDAFTAYKMHKENPNVIFVDVRTPEEYQVIGHIPWAYNIPVKIFTKEWNGKKFKKVKNPRFEKDFMKKFPDKNKTYIIYCRSGHRSRYAIKLLKKLGYKNLYNLWEGFEGTKVPFKFAPSYGKRILDGWKNRGLPWTYKQDSEHAYLEYAKLK